VKSAKISCCGLVFYLLLACPISRAGGVPEHIAAEITDARLAGQGDFRWFGLEIYEAQLWVGAQGFQSTAPAAARFALDLRYARALSGKKIAESSIDEIKKLGFGLPDRQGAWLGQMENCFPDVESGTRLTGIYLPELGVRFYRDGKKICEIRDAEFGRAFFAIWLDPRTTARNLRDSLLVNAMAH
jgi:hypothetical protein